MKILFTVILFLFLTKAYSQYLDKGFKYKDTLKTNEHLPFNGRYVQKYLNGHVQCYGSFKGGLVDSFLYFYDINGIPVFSIIKSNDTICELRYNAKGKLMDESLLINDTPFMVKTYYDDKFNSLKSVLRYKYGRLNGRSHVYFKKKKEAEPSVIYLETNYHFGLKHGIECYYSVKGLPKSSACYSMDTFCYRIFYNKQGERSSVEVNTGGKKPEKKGIPDAVCNCANLTFKD